MEKSKLMHRALTGSATLQEEKDLEKWLAESEQNQEEYNDLKFLYAISLPSDAKADEDSAEAWRNFTMAVERIKINSRRLMILKTLTVSTAICLTVLFAYQAFFAADQQGYIGPDNTLVTTVYFRDTPIQSVIDTLAIKNRSSVTFSPDKLKDCKFTGAFKRGTRLEVILQVIARAKDLNITYVEDHIVLTGDVCRM